MMLPVRGGDCPYWHQVLPLLLALPWQHHGKVLYEATAVLLSVTHLDLQTF